MAVSDLQSWFLPLVKRVSIGKPHRMSDLYEELTRDLELSESDCVVK